MTQKSVACLHQRIGGEKKMSFFLWVATECFMVSPIMPLSLPILLRPLIKVTPTQHATRFLFFSPQSVSGVFFVSQRGCDRQAGQHLDILWIYGSIVASEKEHMSGCSTVHEAPLSGSLFPRLRPHTNYKSFYDLISLISCTIHTIQHALLIYVSCKALVSFFPV